MQIGVAAAVAAVPACIKIAPAPELAALCNSFPQNPAAMNVGLASSIGRRAAGRTKGADANAVVAGRRRKNWRAGPRRIETRHCSARRNYRKADRHLCHKRQSKTLINDAFGNRKSESNIMIDKIIRFGIIA